MCVVEPTRADSRGTRALIVYLLVVASFCSSMYRVDILWYVLLPASSSGTILHGFLRSCSLLPRPAKHLSRATTCTACRPLCSASTIRKAVDTLPSSALRTVQNLGQKRSQTNGFESDTNDQVGRHPRLVLSMSLGSARVWREHESTWPG